MGKQQTSSSVAAWSSWKIVTSRSAWFVCLFDGEQTSSPLPCILTTPAPVCGHSSHICGTARSGTSVLTQNMQCRGHNTPWKLSVCGEHPRLTPTCPPFLKISVPFPALSTKGLQHRRKEPRESTNSPPGLHLLPLLPKRQEEETTMCLQSQSSRLPPCETLLSWFWWSADQKWNGIPVQTSLHGDSSLPPARVLQAHNGLRWAQGEGKSSVTGKNILHFPLEQSRGGRSMVGMKPIRNLSLIRNSDPLTRSSNLQAPSAHAREREGCRECPVFHTTRKATRLLGDKNN